MQTSTENFYRVARFDEALGCPVYLRAGFEIAWTAHLDKACRFFAFEHAFEAMEALPGSAVTTDEVEWEKVRRHAELRRV